MSQNQIVLTDLDDSLFSTARKQASPDECWPVSFASDGGPSGLASPKQRALWDWLRQWGVVVPITARNEEQLHRVRLPFGPHAIWHHGAALRVHGVVDSVWAERTRGILQPAQAAFARLFEAVNQGALGSAGRHLEPARAEPDLGGRILQVVFRCRGSKQGPALADKVRRHLVAHESVPLWVHVQRDSLAVVPSGITKRAAARRLLEILKPSGVIGVGDSPSDVPFMRLCDFCLFPKHSFALEAFGDCDEDGVPL